MQNITHVVHTHLELAAIALGALPVRPRYRQPGFLGVRELPAYRPPLAHASGSARSHSAQVMHRGCCALASTPPLQAQGDLWDP